MRPLPVGRHRWPIGAAPGLRDPLGLARHHYRRRVTTPPRSAWSKKNCGSRAADCASLCPTTNTCGPEARGRHRVGRQHPRLPGRGPMYWVRAPPGGALRLAGREPEPSGIRRQRRHAWASTSLEADGAPGLADPAPLMPARRHLGHSMGGAVACSSARPSTHHRDHLPRRRGHAGVKQRRGIVRPGEPVPPTSPVRRHGGGRS